jgi:molybdopterin-guanine dinucleotide biosynthesis protein A/nucleoside-triphosphatase THEP1
MLNNIVGRIVILSQPIRSGKTTSLMNVISRSPNGSFDGVVCPDVLGRRKLLLIGDSRIIDLEIDNSSEAISVGRFFFNKSSFDIANNWLANIENPSTNIIVDEVGKLELNSSGFHLGLSALIDSFNKGLHSGNLLLVVRDTLLSQVIDKYNLQDALVSTVDDFFDSHVKSSSSTVVGLILCGGKSSRMGRDKALVDYHAMPQYRFVLNQLNNVGIDTLISCRSDQSDLFNDYKNLVIDDGCFLDAGPLSGLLSAFKGNLNCSILALGCDYPMLAEDHIKMLLSFKDFHFPAVSFVRKSLPNMFEPLVTLYHSSCRDLLIKYYEDGNRSLNKFLSSINTLKIEVVEDAFLKSFDSPEDFDGFKSHIL